MHQTGTEAGTALDVFNACNNLSWRLKADSHDTKCWGDNTAECSVFYPSQTAAGKDPYMLLQFSQIVNTSKQRDQTLEIYEVELLEGVPHHI